MYPQEIHQYVRQFFTESNCEIIHENIHYITVQLTIEMDKRIMNRPFYWRYLESTGEKPNPAKLTLITDKSRLVEPIQGEVLHYGSSRINQLFEVTKEQGSFVKMFERVENNPKTILTPWLGVNYKIIYSSNQTREALYSVGINLMTGVMIDDFHELVKNVEMSNSTKLFCLPYTIKPMRAMERLDALIENRIGQDDHSWAEEAKERQRKDLQVLEYFYRGIVNRPESYEIEKKAIEEQYETRIKVDIVNGGLFYLKSI